VPSKVLLGDLRKVLLDVVSSVWSNLFETNLLPGLPPPPRGRSVGGRQPGGVGAGVCARA